MDPRNPAPRPAGVVPRSFARDRGLRPNAERQAARRHGREWLALFLSAVMAVTCGCNKGMYYFTDDELSYYKHAAIDIAHADVHEPSPRAVTESLPPRTVLNPGKAEYWNLSLEEAIGLALQNSHVMADLGGRVLNNPTGAPTVYDPAISQSDPRFGVEGALSAFDAQFTTNLAWSRIDRPLNNALIAGGIPTGSLFILEQDTATFQAQIAKTNAVGGQFRATHNINYDFRNVTSNFFPSAYDGNVEFAFSQPLLQGAGAEFNRIAGPAATPGFFFSSGVLIARINSDISIADFQTAVRNLVSDLEVAYWDLYFSYRNLAAQASARDSALSTWRNVHAKFLSGAVGGAKSDDAQAEQQVHIFQAALVDAQNELLQRERQLRLLMGIPPTDHRIIRPANEPTTARFVPDYYVSLAEALMERVELRRQKWVIKRRELELRAARNFLLPRLDATGLYRINSLGDRLLDSDTSPAFTNFYGELLDGEYTDWQLGLQATIPLGFRQGRAGVKNAQLNLIRERQVLAKQEEQVTHDLSQAIQDVDRFYSTTEKNFNRRRAAEVEVASIEAAYLTGRLTVDRLLDAQRRLADAEAAFFNSVVEYNKALMRAQLAKGTLLEYNNIALAEGPWPVGAYDDAARHAHERMRAIPHDLGIDAPEPFALPQPAAPVEADSLSLFDPLHVEGDSDTQPRTSPANGNNPATLEPEPVSDLDLDFHAVEQADTLPAFLQSSP